MPSVGQFLQLTGLGVVLLIGILVTLSPGLPKKRRILCQSLLLSVPLLLWFCSVESDDGVMTVPDGLQIHVFARQPMLAHPVSLALDRRNRVYVAETHAFKLEDLSGIQEQLSCRTVEDCLRIFRSETAGVDLTDRRSECVRLIEDLDGDGVADQSRVFAEGFDLWHGPAAGVVTRNGNVWLGNTPNLWRFNDADSDGQAEQQTVVHHGFGVRRKLLGHDLHGLIFGPDDKLYFSMGDRGLHVESESGTISLPDTGSILRCDPDGSGLEVFATGFRNAQDLAFDKFGNLWTCDNSANRGDRPRWIYVVEGGDYGWRIGFQTLPDLGPFIQERISDSDASVPWRVPQVGSAGDGPAGIAFNPGTSLPREFDDAFLMCDYTGRVLSIRVRPRGAGFMIDSIGEFAEVPAPTDVAFGIDGAVYIADWISSYALNGQGRLLRVVGSQSANDPDITKTRQLLSQGMTARSLSDLTGLLAHDDMRVRTDAQSELIRRGPIVLDSLTMVLGKENSQLARIHSIWALGRIARDSPDVLFRLSRLLGDSDSEIRAQAARILGDCGVSAAAPALVLCVNDENPRVQYFAAMALGKLKCPAAGDALIEFIRNSDTSDPFLRHAGVMALTGIADLKLLERYKEDSAVPVRLAVVLALRRLKNSRVAAFLDDTDPSVSLAAARAIHDEPIAECMGQLADAITCRDLPEAAMRRAVNANFRLGGCDRAAAISIVAADVGMTEALRIEALQALGGWSSDTVYDRILGRWRPLQKRPADDAIVALSEILSVIADNESGSVAVAAVAAADKLDIREPVAQLRNRVADENSEPELRARALAALARQNAEDLSTVVNNALQSDAAVLRRQAVLLVNQAELSDPLKRLLEIIRHDASPGVQQVAIRILGETGGESVDDIITALLDEAASDRLSPELHLELMEAAAIRASAKVKDALRRLVAQRPAADPVAPWWELRHGGSANAGRQIFLNHPSAQCIRCHDMRQTIGKAGPSLFDVGSRLSRRKLLESILFPNAMVADGFARTVLALDDGTIREGVIVTEDDQRIALRLPDGSVISVSIDTVEDRSAPLSAMPQNIADKLSKREIRDLVEFLAGRKATQILTTHTTGGSGRSDSPGTNRQQSH